MAELLGIQIIFPTYAFVCYCIMPEFMIMGCLFSHIFRADIHMNVERIDFYISRTISSQSQKLGERVQRHR